MGEAWSNPKGLKSLTEKICNQTDVGFWTYTNRYTLCSECYRRTGNDVEGCPHCGCNELEEYSRITGYLQRTSGWNRSKQAELGDRHEH